MYAIPLPNFGSIVRQLRTAAATIQDTSKPPISDGLRAANAIYLAAQRRRFIQNSRGGGGEWPPLARSTKLARARRGKTARKRFERKVKKAGFGSRRRKVDAALASMAFPILRVTNTLFASLTAGAPGNIEQLTPDGVIGGSAVHYAEHHQNPKVPGRPPQRKIFHDPDTALAERMSTPILSAVQEVITGAKNQ